MSKKYVLPELPYAYDALEPHISAEIMELHHSKHHQNYVNGANAALEKLEAARKDGSIAAVVTALSKDLAFNLGGHTNHSLFWENLGPNGGGKPTGALAAAIDADFGSFEEFQKHFAAAALGLQGSGWADDRPAGQPVYRPGAIVAARHVGARFLPPVQEREGGLCCRCVERVQLG